MKVCMLQQHLRLAGGSGEDVAVYYLVKALSKLNVEITLLVQEFSVDKRMNEVNFIKVKAPYSLRCFLKKTALDKSYSFSVIHSHEVSRAFLFAFLKKKKQPLIVHYHNPITSQPRPIGRFILTLNKSDKIFVPSNFVRQRLINLCRINQNKIDAIYNGVDINEFRHRISREILVKYRIPEDGNIVLYVGRFSPVKGLLTLIRAIPFVLNAFPSTYFVFVGLPSSPEYFQKMVALAKSLKVYEKCIFTSFIPRSDLPFVISRADVFVLPSIIESFGQSVIEALACETPVVSTLTGGIPEIVNNKVGLLVEPKDAVALSNAIVRLLSDRKLARNMGKAGRKIVEKRFDWNRIAEKVKQKYEELLSA